MIKSMTGFGRYEAADEKHKIVTEIKSVNHRYLDITLKMPRRFNRFEARIRTLMKEYAGRGKVDIFISYEDYSDDNLVLHYNENLASEYLQYCRQMRDFFGLTDDVTVSRLAGFPDVLTMEQQEEDETTVWPALEAAIRGAGSAFASQRAEEGQRLAEDILGKLTHMEELVGFVETRSPQVVTEYRERLTEKMKELLESASVDESRILTEAALFADKTCVDEETVRLRSHIQEMRKTLTDGNPEGIGRKLDFLAQEMNREANTTLSKCNDIDISGAAISLKTEIEKIREQVQNIE